MVDDPVKIEKENFPSLSKLTKRETRFGFNNWTVGVWWVDRPTWSAIGVGLGPLEIVWRTPPITKAEARTRSKQTTLR